jgi:transposase
MSNKKLAMTKLKRIIQMLSEHYSQNEICQETSSSKKTVSMYKKLADDTEFSYQELLHMEDSKLESLLQPPTVKRPEDPRKAQLDEMMPKIIQRLSQRYANVQLVYNEYYIKNCPDGYKYTQFKKYINDYKKANSYSYHNSYVPGEEWQIDFAGDSLYLTDKNTGEITEVVVLVCVMPYSQMPFLMALPNATTDWFFNGLNRGLEYLGALPSIAKSDNMKQWVTKSDRYCPVISEACAEWANYYGIGTTACRVRHPRDKGPVESAVNQLYKYIYARIQNEVFFTLSDLNNRLWILLDEYNNRPYRGSSRMEIYLNEEKPRMAKLPAVMHSFRYRKEVKLGPTYHVCVGQEHHYYSVPYTYVGQTVKVMWDAENVEIYSGNTLICTHDRSMVWYGYTTDKNHMPEAHKAYEHSRQYNAATIIDQASFIGPSVRWTVEEMLTKSVHPQQSYGQCQAVIALSKKYGRDRLENACRKMKDATSMASLRVLSNMLKNNRDLADQSKSSTTVNDSVRGASAYTHVNSRKEGLQ